MAWVMIDDLTGDQVPEGRAHRLTLHLDRPLLDAGDTSEIAAWDVATDDVRGLLAQLGEHLAGVAAPLRADVDGLGAPERHALELLRIGQSYAEVGSNGSVHDADAQAGGAEVRQPSPAGGQDTGLGAADGSEPEESTAGVSTGEATAGRATDSVVRAWASEHGIPCSAHGRLNVWARAGYERVQGGEPDAQLWHDARPKLADPDAPTPAASGVKNPPSLDPSPPGRAAAGTSPATGTPDPAVAEGDPPPDPPETGRAAGPATIETPELASSGAPPAPAPGGEAGAGAARVAVTAIGDGGPEDLEAHAEELLSAKRTPREVASATGLSLEQVRAISQDMRRRS